MKGNWRKKVTQRAHEGIFWKLRKIEKLLGQIIYMIQDSEKQIVVLHFCMIVAAFGMLRQKKASIPGRNTDRDCEEWRHNIVLRPLTTLINTICILLWDVVFASKD